jgi:hypothetical protein
MNQRESDTVQEDVQRLAARTIHRQRLIRIFIAAMRASDDAREIGEFRGAAKALTTASKAADRLARMYGVLTRDDAAENAAMAAAARLVEATTKLRQNATKCDSRKE